jgi:hypothetical protein
MDEFLVVPTNRALAREISLQVAGVLEPSEAGLNKHFVDPLLDMMARGETMTTETARVAMGLGGGELVLMIAVSIVVHVLSQFLRQLGETNFEAVIARVNGETGMQIAQVASVACREQKTPEWVSLSRLRQILAEYFNISELRGLCFDLGIDYENLPGETRSDFAREVLDYAKRHGQIPELFAKVKELRPHASWEKVPGDGERAMIAYISMSDVERVVSGTRFAQNQKNLGKLARALNVVLHNHFVSQYGS